MSDLLDFPTMTPQEEFEMFVEDALEGSSVDREDLLNYFCEQLGIAYCDENMDELMDEVINDPYVLNELVDALEADF